MTELADLTEGAPRSARAALEAAGISVEKLRDLFVVQPHQTVRNLLGAGVSFAAVPLLAWAFPNPVIYVACLAVALHNFNSLAQIVHASDHGTLFRGRRLNAMVGNLCAYPLGYNRAGHRNAHLDHHLYLNTSKDPDLIFNPPDQTSRGLLVSFLQDLLLVSALKRFVQYFQGDRSYSESVWRGFGKKFFVSLAKGLGPVLLVQGAILALFTATAGPWFYLWLHVLPIMTLYPAQIRMRSMVEHSVEAGRDQAQLSEAWLTRTILPNALERFIVAPLGQNYHYEHHLFPNVPEYNLAKVHRLLVESGVTVPISRGYVRFLFRKIAAGLDAARIQTTPG